MENIAHPNKKNIFIWALYDFANSIVFITFLLYFSKWLVVSRGLSDWWYNAIFIFGSIGLVFLAPWLGNKVDRSGQAKKYLSFSTFGCFCFYLLAGLSAIYGAPILWPVLFFGLGNFLYQISFIFYNPLLSNITDDHSRGKISGLGLLANYLGQIAGVLISLLISARLAISGLDPLVAPLIPASLIFIILSLPLIFSRGIFAKQNNLSSTPPLSQLELLKKIKNIPGLMLFMLAFFLFSDALTTIINNFSILTTNLFPVSDKQISILTLGIIIAAGIGAWLWGMISDKIGPKKSMIAVLISWIILTPAISFTYNYPLYFGLIVVAGASLGGTFAISRQFFILLTPKEILHYNFGLYAISERAATFVGPLLWSLALNLGNYRLATFSMVIFQIMAVILILKINNPKINLAHSL